MDTAILKDILISGLSTRREADLLRFPEKNQPTLAELIAAKFRALGKTTTEAEALAIAVEAGNEGAALIEIATLAKRRAHTLSLRTSDVFGDAS